MTDDQHPRREAISYAAVPKRCRTGLRSRERQRAALDAFAAEANVAFVGHFEDLVTRQDDGVEKRPAFAAAVAAAEGRGVLLVAAGPDELGHGDPLVLVESIVAAKRVAFVFARAGLQRTALAVALEGGLVSERRRAVKLARAEIPAIAVQARAAGMARAVQLRPHVEPLVRRGLNPHATARALNEAGIPASDGGRWHQVNAKRLIDRIKVLMRADQDVEKISEVV